MDNNYAYIGVPSITQEMIGNGDPDHPIASSETHTLPEPNAQAEPKLSASTLNWKSLITPIGTLVFGVVLALGHHTFNAWEDGKAVVPPSFNAWEDRDPVKTSVISQQWVTHIGVALSFGFKTAVGVTMGFVLLQCLWHSVVHQPLTMKQIDTMYRIERQDQLYKTLPQAVFFSPIIVIFSALILFLPLSGIFAPGSLTVTTKNSTVISNCTIPTGNISGNGLDSFPGFTLDLNGGNFSNPPKLLTLTMQLYVDHRIPDLPQACGPNCCYKVHVPSFVFNCTPNPSSLPYGQAGDESSVNFPVLWNGTTAQIGPNDSMGGFYIAWQSNGPNGTSGNALCMPFQAQYDIEVKTNEGVQSVLMNITEITSPIPSFSGAMFKNSPSHMQNFWILLAAISSSTQNLFMGLVYLNLNKFLIYDLRVSLLPFLDIHLGEDYPQFIWGDVLKGIEELSHNVTASLLTMPFGTTITDCDFYLHDVVYQYNSAALWVPYGTALGVALISLVVAVMIMASNHTGGITTSFSDTANLMRDVDADVLTGEKLRLRAADDGKLGYTLA